MLTGMKLGDEIEISKDEIIKKAVDMLNTAIQICAIQNAIDPNTEDEDKEQFIKMEASRLFANALLDTNIELTEHGYTVAQNTQGGVC